MATLPLLAKPSPTSSQKAQKPRASSFTPINNALSRSQIQPLSPYAIHPRPLKNPPTTSALIAPPSRRATFLPPPSQPPTLILEPASTGPSLATASRTLISPVAPSKAHQPSINLDPSLLHTPLKKTSQQKAPNNSPSSSSLIQAAKNYSAKRNSIFPIHPQLSKVHPYALHPSTHPRSISPLMRPLITPSQITNASPSQLMALPYPSVPHR